MKNTDIIPGRIKYEWREVVYVEVPFNKDFEAELFNELVTACHPIIGKSGSVVSENFVIITPDNVAYFGLSYNEDIDGWRTQIVNGADQLGLSLGMIKEGDVFVTTRRDIYDLRDCQFERYNFYDQNRVLNKERTAIDKELLFD